MGSQTQDEIQTQLSGPGAEKGPSARHLRWELCSKRAKRGALFHGSQTGSATARASKVKAPMDTSELWSPLSQTPFGSFQLTGFARI